MTVPEAFRLVPKDDGLYWFTGGGVVMLVLGTVLVGLAIGPYLPARLPAILHFGGREDVENVRELIGALVLPGLTAIAFGVGVFLRDIGYFLIMVVVTLGFWRWVVRPSQRPATAASGEHRVEVHDVRPLPDEKDPYDPYHVAICDCGWVGDAVGTSGEAFEQARAHSSVVSDEVRRPVG